MNLIKWCDRVIRGGFYLLFILIPLILTPINYELFEYNKMMLTYGLTVIIVSAWLIKSFKEGELKIAKTPLDIPIFLFLGSQFISSLFSIDPHVSWFGYYSRFNGGMLSIIAYVLLYFAFVSNFSRESEIKNQESWRKTKTQKDQSVLPIIHNSLFIILRIALVTATIVATYGVLERFGIDKNLWVQDVQNRVFSTLGQPNWLAAYLVALAPLAWGFAVLKFVDGKQKIVMEKEKRKMERHNNLFSFFQNLQPISIFYILISILFFLVLLFTRSRSGLLGFVVADLIFWGLLFFSSSFKHLRFPFVIYHLAFVIIVFVNGTYIESLDKYFSLRGWQERFAKSSSQANKTSGSNTGYIAPLLETGGTQSSKIRKYVWQAAVTAWKNSSKTMLIGTGTETFAFAFFQFRPAEHNLTSEWDFLYNKAHNEYLNYLATTGIFGLGSYLLIICSFIVWFLKIQNSKFKIQNYNAKFKSEHNEDALAIALFSGWISILVTNFFGFSVVIIQLFFFLLPAIIFMMIQQSDKLAIKEYRFVVSGSTFKPLALTVVIISLYLIFVLVRFWRADTLFASGYRQNRSGYPAQAAIQISRASTLNPGEPLYHDELGPILAQLAQAAMQAQDATSAAQLVKQALSSSDTALAISPKNVNFWKSRTKIYYNLSEFDAQFNPAAIQSLTQAQSLSPTDPKIYYNLAILYGRQNDTTKAIEALKKAIELKPNYRDSYWALYVFYNEAHQPNLAEVTLREYLTTVDPGDKEFQQRLIEK